MQTLGEQVHEVRRTDHGAVRLQQCSLSFSLPGVCDGIGKWVA